MEYSSSVKLEKDAVVHSQQCNNSEAVITYCALCDTFVAIVRKFPVLPRRKTKRSLDAHLDCMNRISRMELNCCETEIYEVHK